MVAAKCKKDDLELATFVGRGSPALRATRNALSSPFEVGRHGSKLECQVKFAEYLAQSSSAWGLLNELKPSVVICECELDEPCTGDIVLAWSAALRMKDGGIEAKSPYWGMWRRVPRKSTKLAILVSSTLAASVGSVPQCVSLRFTQWAVDRAVRKLFPPEYLAGFQMPCLEDLINTEPFTTFPEFLDNLDLDADRALGPCHFKDTRKGTRAAAANDQRTHFFTKGHYSQLVPLGLEPDDHFLEAMKLADTEQFPMDSEPITPADLKCAVLQSVVNLKSLPDARYKWYCAVKELAARSQPLSVHLRQFQVGPAAKVASKINIGLIAIAVILMSWPHWRLPSHFVSGFKVVGLLESTGVYQSVPFHKPSITRDELLDTSEALISSIETRPPKLEAVEHIMAACLKDYTLGFGSKQYLKTELDEKWGIGKWIPLPTFDHVQASGKHRRIDNGLASGHNEATAYSEALELCNAFQPGFTAKLFYQTMVEAGIPWEEIQGVIIESGGEDMPDAYRWLPVEESDQCLNIVAAYDVERKAWTYQELFGMLFGLSSSVMNFNPWSAFLEALSRRWLFLAVSMFYDDSRIIDVNCARGRGQRYLQALFRLVGAPLAEEKSEKLSCDGDFLGLVHKTECALSDGWMSFEPRKRITDTLQSIISKCLEDDWCEPSDANKIRGIKNFASCGQFGQIGRVGLGPLAVRQYADKPPWHLSGRLRRALEFLECLEKVAVPRCYYLYKPWTPPLIIASDGRVDDNSPPSAGVCVFDPIRKTRVAWWMVLCPELIARWEARHSIMEVESVPVVTLMLSQPGLFMGRDVVWFIDNVATLSAFIKGGSDAVDLDRSACVASLVMGRLCTRVWFEYVESHSNWSDGISRLLSADPFCAKHSFALRQAFVPAWPWTVPVGELVLKLCTVVGAALEVV